MPDRSTLAIHGIWVAARRINWIEHFEHEARYRLDVRPREYGFVSGFLTYFSCYRNLIVGVEAEYARLILSGAPPPNVIAHSFGGYVAWALMARRGIKFHNVLLLAPAAPAGTNWKGFEGNFSLIRVYWSKRDEILGFARYGKMGLVGPLISHPRVESVQTELSHNEHVRSECFPEYIEFLTQEGDPQ